ncbi:hypothetical protein CDEF62S_03014 [Castellaniella defragrans]
MQVVSIISTKGGVGKTTTAANLGGLAADAGLRVLLLDLDVQPTLSSYYELGSAHLVASTSCWPSTSATSGCWCPAGSSRAWTWCSPTTTEVS